MIKHKLTGFTFGMLLTIALPLLAATIYNQFSPGGALSGTWNSQNVNLGAGSPFIAGALPAANLPNVAASSFLGNTTTSAAAQASVNPLAGANMMGALLSARVVATSNIASLSGLQSIDGVAGVASTSAFLTQQSTPSQNGIWIMNTGAWTRPINFPSGYVIPAFCDLAITIEQGTVNQNSHWQLNTIAGNVTIDTTAQTWSARNTPGATPTQAGLVTTTTATGLNKVAVVNPAPGAGGIGFAVTFADANGSITDAGNAAGNQGPPVVSDASGHPWQDNAVNFPSANHGTVGCAQADASGCVTGLSAVTSLTLTFGGTWPYTPSCGSVPAPTIAPTASTSAVTFTLTALTGTLNYWCL